MFVTKDTIIAEILQNDPTQGCVPIFPPPVCTAWAAWLPTVKRWSRRALSTVWTPTRWLPS